VDMRLSSPAHSPLLPGSHHSDSCFLTEAVDYQPWGVGWRKILFKQVILHPGHTLQSPRLQPTPIKSSLQTWDPGING
jgi:hypothetical protein